MCVCVYKYIHKLPTYRWMLVSRPFRGEPLATSMLLCVPAWKQRTSAAWHHAATWLQQRIQTCNNAVAAEIDTPGYKLELRQGGAPQLRLHTEHSCCGSLHIDPQTEGQKDVSHHGHALGNTVMTSAGRSCHGHACDHENASCQQMNSDSDSCLVCISPQDTYDMCAEIGGVWQLLLEQSTPVVLMRGKDNAIDGIEKHDSYEWFLEKTTLHASAESACQLPPKGDTCCNGGMRNVTEAHMLTVVHEALARELRDATGADRSLPWNNMMCTSTESVEATGLRETGLRETGLREAQAEVLGGDGDALAQVEVNAVRAKLRAFIADGSDAAISI
jgi:hypothetical protein